MANKFKSMHATPLVDTPVDDVNGLVTTLPDCETPEYPNPALSQQAEVLTLEQPTADDSCFIGLPSSSTENWVKAKCLVTARPGYGGRSWALTKNEVVMLPREVGLALRKTKMVTF